MKRLTLIGLSLALQILCSLGCMQIQTTRESWSQFRGDSGTPAAPNQRVPDHFGPNKNVLWKKPVPAGSSSPCIWNDRIFMTGHDGNTLSVFCCSRSDGALLWSTEFSMGGNEDLQHRHCSPAAPTTCVDSERVHAYFGAYGLVALDHDGNVLWEKKFPIEENLFGTGTSPILHDGLLYLVRDVSGPSEIYCFDAASGKPRWTRPRPHAGPNYATPYLWQRDGRDEIVVIGSTTLQSYDATTGDDLWVVKNVPMWVCPSPVAVDNILIAGGYTAMNDRGPERMKTAFDLETNIPDDVIRDAELFIRYFDKDGDGKVQENEFPESRIRDTFLWGDANRDGGWERKEIEPFMVSDPVPGRNVLLAVRGGGVGDITDTHILWETTRTLPYVASPLAYGGRVYFVKKGGLLSCLDLATGKPVYGPERLGIGGEYYACPVAVGDRILVGAERGTLFVLSAGSEFEVIARNDLGESICATPAVVDDTLYVRTSQHLWAFQEKEPGNEHR